jgi:hypothetical protein
MVVSNRHRWHIKLSHPIQGRSDAEQTVDQGVFAVEPEVNKRGHA